MNFDELTEIWRQDNNGSARIDVNKKLLKEVSFHTIKNNLKEVKWGSIFEVVINYIWIFFLVEFIIGNFGQINFSLPAAILLFIAIYSVIFESYKLYLYFNINTQLPILKTQQKLEKLKFLELFDTNSLYFIIPVFFVPFVVVISKGILGIDIYDMGFSEREILFGTLGSFLVSSLVIYFLKLYPSKKLIESIDYIKDLKEIQNENNDVINKV